MMQKDKTLHFIAGTLLAVVAYMFTLSLAWAIIVPVVVGALKEVYDYFSPKHDVEFLDWVATVAGGAVIVAILFFV